MTTPEPRATALRQETISVLGPLADLVAPVAPGADAPWDQLVRIAEHQVDLAATCGASLAYEGEFPGWRAAFARRRIGRAVLERMRRGATLDPTSLASAIVDDEARSSQSSLASWLGELGPGGRAAVVRDAVTFVVAARAAMRTWPPREGTRFDDAFQWQLPGRAVRLEAGVDAVTRPTRSLLVLVTAVDDEPGERRDCAWPAFVATLRTGQVPREVTRIDLVSGERRTVPVTDDVLDLGLTAAAAAIEAAVAARFTAPATPTPGPWCRWCQGRSGPCGPGANWSSRSVGIRSSRPPDVS
jgi:hypothetical protein